MKCVTPSVEFVGISKNLTEKEILEHLEECGRTAYKSEDKIKDGSAEKFIKAIIKRGHESVIEHFGFTVRIVTDRGLTHELVRHRLASFTQESTRYCLYALDKFGNEITVIKPSGINQEKQVEEWFDAMDDAERHYLKLIELGVKPEDARSVLPTCTKAEIVITANFREWRHIISLRTESGAHPDIRLLCGNILELFRDKIPVLFDDIEVQ